MLYNYSTYSVNVDIRMNIVLVGDYLCIVICRPFLMDSTGCSGESVESRLPI